MAQRYGLKAYQMYNCGFGWGGKVVAWWIHLFAIWNKHIQRPI